MDMDELIFEMGQPNEIITTPEWTEWWAVDSTGLHLEYADGYEPEQYYEYSETAWDDEFATTKSFTIDAGHLYKSQFQYIADRWPEVFGKSDVDGTSDDYEPRYYPYPISTDIDNPDYLESLQGAIDHYNEWYHGSPKTMEVEVEVEEELEVQEESVVDLPKNDGLILPCS